MAFSKMRSVLVAGLLACASVPTALVSDSVANAGVTVTIDGHGWGHGVGLSQYGALGYAVNYGWSAAQILDHYYGGTVAATASNDLLSVRLTLLDGSQTAVVHDKAALVIGGFAPAPDQPPTWRSLVARPTSSGHYRVWGRTDANVCPNAALDLNDPINGWVVVIPDQSTAAVFAPQVDTSASADPSDLVGVCEPGTYRIRHYRGSIGAVNSSGGSARTVNQVPVEQYLRSVVGGEVSPGWASVGQGKGAQALQAQAVAARSYGLAENKETYAKTCDTTNCQVYRGAAYRFGYAGAFVAQEFAETDAAVSATAGVVRRYGSQSGAIAYTMFSSSSGGFTAKNSLGFTPVADEGDAYAGNGAHSWSVAIDSSVIQSAWPAIGTYSSIVVDTRDGNGEWGGRVLTMTLKGSAGSVSISGDTFRSRLGLKSTWFQVRGAVPPPPPPKPSPSDPCAGRNTTTVAGAGANPTASRFTPLTPVRLVDTRYGVGTAQVALGGGCTLTIDPDVAADATAVVVNVTSVSPAANGYITAYPCGAVRPFTSIVPAVAGRIVPGTAIVPLGVDGTFCIFASMTTDLVVDLTGIYQTGAGQRFEPVAPQRRFDSRSGPMLPGGSFVRVQIAGSQGVPASATAAAVTVHSTDGIASGYVTIWPCDVARPTTSILNATAGAAVANHSQVGLDGYGGICLFVATPMHVVLDLSGWFGPTATTNYHALMSQRVLDTRYGIGLTDGSAAGQNRSIGVIGVGGVPAVGVAAVAAEVTSVGAIAAGFVTVHPCQDPVPNLSMVRNFADSVAATTVVGVVDGAGRWCLRANVAMHLLIDISGWYGAGP